MYTGHSPKKGQCVPYLWSYRCKLTRKKLLLQKELQRRRSPLVKMMSVADTIEKRTHYAFESNPTGTTVNTGTKMLRLTQPPIVAVQGEKAQRNAPFLPGRRCLWPAAADKYISIHATSQPNAQSYVQNIHRLINWGGHVLLKVFVHPLGTIVLIPSQLCRPRPLAGQSPVWAVLWYQVSFRLDTHRKME